MSKIRYAALMGLLFATSCAEQPGPANSEFCQVAGSPIRPLLRDVDAISDELVRQIMAYNRKGQDRCGWKLF